MISRTGKSYSYSPTMHQFKQKLHCQLSERERTIPPYFSPHSCMIGIGTRSRAKTSLAFVCEWLWVSLFLWKDGQKGNEGRFTRFVFTQSYKSVSSLQTHTSTHTHPFTNFFFFLQGWSWGQLRRTKCIQEATTSTAKGTGPTALKQNGVDMSVRGENIGKEERFTHVAQRCVPALMKHNALKSAEQYFFWNASFLQTLLKVME